MISPTPAFTLLLLTLFDDMLQYSHFAEIGIFGAILTFLQAKGTLTIYIFSSIILFTINTITKIFPQIIKLRLVNRK